MQHVERHIERHVERQKVRQAALPKTPQPPRRLGSERVWRIKELLPRGPLQSESEGFLVRLPIAELRQLHAVMRAFCEGTIVDLIEFALAAVDSRTGHLIDADGTDKPNVSY